VIVPKFNVVNYNPKQTHYEDIIDMKKRKVNAEAERITGILAQKVRK